MTSTDVSYPVDTSRGSSSSSSSAFQSTVDSVRKAGSEFSIDDVVIANVISVIANEHGEVRIPAPLNAKQVILNLLTNAVDDMC
jgi:hypothetical protein